MTAICFWYAVRCDRSSYSLDEGEAFYLCSFSELLLLCLSIHLYVKVEFTIELWLPSGTIQQPVSSIDNTILWQIHHYAFKNIFNYIHLALVGCYINVYGFQVPFMLPLDCQNTVNYFTTHISMLNCCIFFLTIPS